MTILTRWRPAPDFSTLQERRNRKAKLSFAVIRFNQETYESGGVMAVVRGHLPAEQMVRDFESGRSEADRHAGWRYFLEETDLTPGMDAGEATRVRQLQLYRQELEA